MAESDQAIRRGEIQWRRQHQKRYGTTVAQRGEAKKQLQQLRRRAARGDLAARLVLLAGAVPRRRQ
jgi:hypothetical protein